MINLLESVTAAEPAPGVCLLCEKKLDGTASLRVRHKVMFKTVEKKVCLQCAKDAVDLIELRVVQAERGEFDP